MASLSRGAPKRITFDRRHFYISLVFYNYLMRCFVLIDNKTDLTHQGYGPDTNVRELLHAQRAHEQKATIRLGIVLCARQSNSIVEYTLCPKTTTKCLPYSPAVSSKQEGWRAS